MTLGARQDGFLCQGVANLSRPSRLLFWESEVGVGLGLGRNFCLFCLFCLSVSSECSAHTHPTPVSHAKPRYFVFLPFSSSFCWVGLGWFGLIWLMLRNASNSKAAKQQKQKQKQTPERASEHLCQRSQQAPRKHLKCMNVRERYVGGGGGAGAWWCMHGGAWCVLLGLVCFASTRSHIHTLLLLLLHMQRGFALKATSPGPLRLQQQQQQQQQPTEAAAAAATRTTTTTTRTTNNNQLKRSRCLNQTDNWALSSTPPTNKQTKQHGYLPPGLLQTVHLNTAPHIPRGHQRPPVWLAAPPGTAPTPDGTCPS